MIIIYISRQHAVPARAHSLTLRHTLLVFLVLDEIMECVVSLNSPSIKHVSPIAPRRNSSADCIYLPSHADAAALSSQCHRWHRLCDMSNRRKYRRVKLRETLDLAVALRMLRSILKTPQYGEYVRYIELNRSPSLDYSFFVRSYEIKPPQRSLCPEDQDRLTEAIRRAGFDSPEEQEKVLNVLLQSPGTMEQACFLPIPFLNYSTNQRKCLILTLISHNDPRAPFLAQALAALLVSVSPLLESLSFCPVGQEPSKFAKLRAQSNGTPLEESDYFFKQFLDRANSRSHCLTYIIFTGSVFLSILIQKSVPGIFTSPMICTAALI